MFRRRDKLQVHDQVREAVWPRMGWRRLLSYLQHRVGRMNGSPYSIAAGFACGAAISFTPFIGFHLILGGLLAWAARASIIASAIGTFIGNPWTFPFIWIGIYRTGNLILGRESLPLSVDLLSVEHLLEHMWEIFVPMVVGGTPIAVLVWIGFYFPLRGIVTKYQAARRRRIAKRRGRESRHHHGQV